MMFPKKVYTVMVGFATDVSGDWTVETIFTCRSRRGTCTTWVKKLNSLVLRCAPQAAERRKL